MNGLQIYSSFTKENFCWRIRQRFRDKDLWNLTSCKDSLTYRTILLSSVMSYRLETVLQESSDLMQFRPERWLSSAVESRVWL